MSRTNNKLIGLINILLGVLNIVWQLVFATVTYRLTTVYDQFGAQKPSAFQYFNIFSIIVVIVSLYFIYVGFRLYKNKESGNLLTQGQVGTIILIVLIFLPVIMSIPAIILPIYNLQLQ